MDSANEAESRDSFLQWRFYCRGMPRNRYCKKTFYNWAEAYPEFKEVVDHGMIAAESWWIEKGRENVDNRKFNHALWLLMMVNRFKWHSAYAKKEEKKEIINEHKVEVKNAVDIDSILQKSIQSGIDQIEKEKVH